MKQSIFITGASGNVGAALLSSLQGRGVQIIAAKRPGSQPKTSDEILYRDFDFTDPGTWESALEGVHKVFLMRPPHISNIKRDMLPFLQFLQSKSLQQVQFLSVQGAENNKVIPHHKVEQYCMNLDLPYTFLRPSFFMQNLTTTHLEEIRDDKMLFVPSGEGKTNFIDVRDIGAVSAELFLSEDHIRTAYTITGEHSYSHGEIARYLSEGLGEDIRFVNPNPFRFVFYHIRKGTKPGMALVMLALYSVVKMGKGDITTNSSQEILGRQTISLETFIQDHRDLLKGIAL